MALQVVSKQDQFVILPSAARTATPTIDDFRVGRVGGLIVVIDVTATVTTPSVTFTILGKDEPTTKTWTLLASSPITATGTTILQVHPTITAVANLKAAELVPSLVTVTAVHADADSITYSVTGIVTA